METQPIRECRWGEPGPWSPAPGEWPPLALLRDCTSGLSIQFNLCHPCSSTGRSPRRKFFPPWIQTSLWVQRSHLTIPVDLFERKYCKSISPFTLNFLPGNSFIHLIHFGFAVCMEVEGLLNCKDVLSFQPSTSNHTQNLFPYLSIHKILWNYKSHIQSISMTLQKFRTFFFVYFSREWKRSLTVKFINQ